MIESPNLQKTSLIMPAQDSPSVPVDRPQLLSCIADSKGILWVQQGVATPGTGVIIPPTSVNGTSDNITFVGPAAACFNYIYDATGANWDRVTGHPNNTDVLSSAIANTPGSTAFAYAWNGVDTWVRIGRVDLADAVANGFNTINGFPVAAVTSQYDPTAAKYIPVQNNQNVSLLAGAARTVLTNSADQTNRNFRGLHAIVNVTVAGAAGSITPVIQGKDSISGTYYDILVGTAITTTGVNVIKVYPGIGAIANGAAADILPVTWRVQMRVATADSYTYSVSVALMQ